MLGTEDGNLGKFADDSKEDIPPTAAAFSSARRTASSSATRAASSASSVALDFHQPAHDAEDVVGKIVDVDDVEVVAREMAEQTTNDTAEGPLAPPPLALLPIQDDDVVDCIVQTDRVAAACRDGKRPNISVY